MKREDFILLVVLLQDSSVLFDGKSSDPVWKSFTHIERDSSTLKITQLNCDFYLTPH